MNKQLKKILAIPARWRRSHGFGVHSTFAYNFITKVIREKKAVYYAYAEIAAFCPRAKKATFNEIFAGMDISIPEAHLLFRLLCHFNPKDVLEIGHGHEVTNIITSRAIPSAKIHYWNFDATEVRQVEGEPLVLINQFPADKTDNLSDMLLGLIRRQDCVIIARNLRHIPLSEQLWENITSFREFGMSFSDEYTGIFVARRALPRQDYDIFF